MSPVVLYFVFWWPVSKSRNTRVERLSLMVYLPGSVGRTRRFVSFLWVMECPREHIILLKVFYSYCGLFLGERIISTSISSHEICGVTRAYSLAARSCAKNIWSDHDDCHPHFTLGWQWARLLASIPLIHYGYPLDWLNVLISMLLSTRYVRR